MRTSAIISAIEIAKITKSHGMEVAGPAEVQQKIEKVFYRSLDEVLKEHIDIHDDESETFGERWKRGELKPTFRLL